MGNDQSTGSTSSTQSTGGSTWDSQNNDGKGTVRYVEISSLSGKFFV